MHYQQDAVSEKATAVEQIESNNSLKSGLGDGFQRDPALEKKLVWRMDLLLMPIMSIMFIFLFLDRGNIGNARVAGLQKDIGASDFQFQLALMVTYIPYVLIELISNLVLRVISPKIMLPGLVLAWGLVSLLQCQVRNAAGLLACRFFLGLCEGGLFPGFVLYLSGFYRRHEMQKRIGCIYGAASISGAFSGLLAAAIQQLDGKGGIAGWSWIFLLEGLATILFSLVAFWLLPNSPENIPKISAEEVEYAYRRLRADAAIQENTTVSLSQVLSIFKDFHILNMGLIAFCNGIVISGLAYFTPSIVEALGYGATKTQLMSVPPYAIAFVLTMIAAYVADKFHQRGLTALVTLSLAIIGCIINLSSTSIGARYTAQCLNVASIYSTAPTLLTWVPNNAAGYARRASAIGFLFVTSNAAGMVSMWLYPTSTAPRYLLGTRVNLSFVSVEWALIVVQLIILRSLNKRKVSKREEILSGYEDLSEHEQMEVLGDRHPDFRYTM